MTFADANHFLRYLVRPTTAELVARNEIATALFQAVERGDEEITTSEVVLHEVVYVLASKKHYAMAPAHIAVALKLILALPGFKLPRGQKRLYRRALDLYAAYPHLGFADAVVAASVQGTAIRLAAFDRDFDRILGILYNRDLRRRLGGGGGGGNDDAEVDAHGQAR